MSTVYALYTGHGLMEPLRNVFQEEFPGHQLVNVIDDSIIRTVRESGGVTPAIASRIMSYYSIAGALEADVILNTCSSVGDVADRAEYFSSVPIVRIDRAMAKLAVEKGSTIGVVATIPTTLEPTIRLVEAEAKAAGKEIVLEPVLAKGAYDALVSGKPEDHDRLIQEAAEAVSGKVDVFVLAQGSMARMEAGLETATGKTVLSSIRLGIRSLSPYLGEV